MKLKWLIIFFSLLIVSGLYLLQMSTIDYNSIQNIANLDDLKNDEAAAAWEPFYRVRATLLDGQSARFSIPNELSDKVGQDMELTGAAVFFGNGCVREGDTITVSRFYLLPSLGLAQACEIEPDIEMRWTIRIHLKEHWILHRDDMINAMAKVKGRFRIDTSEPYDGVFFLEDATTPVIQSIEYQ
jgi:hypothetical protein